MKAADCLITIFLFCEVYEGTSFVNQNLHTVDSPSPAGEDQVCEYFYTAEGSVHNGQL